jgi:hypothetical protein
MNTLLRNALKMQRQLLAFNLLSLPLRRKARAGTTTAAAISGCACKAMAVAASRRHCNKFLIS